MCGTRKDSFFQHSRRISTGAHTKKREDWFKSSRSIMEIYWLEQPLNYFRLFSRVFSSSMSSLGSLSPNLA